MTTTLSRALAALSIAAGAALLVLANAGLLNLDPPFVRSLPPARAADDPITAFVNVSVVPMDAERVLPGQTVIVRGERIEWVGEAADARIPEGARVIDGTGRYLMPGLADMHVHVQDENDLVLLVASGVTTVRNLWGSTGLLLALGVADQLDLREAIREGRLFGPTVYTAGPVMEGDPPTVPLMEVFRTPDAAARSVAWQAARGYDAVKVYDRLTPEVYAAILRAAAAHGLPVVGHVPAAVGLDAVLAGGQRTIEHLSGYIDPDRVEWLIPEDRLDEYAARTRAAGVWNVVTLGEYPKSGLPPAGVAALAAQPGMAYVSPGMRLFSPFFYDQAAAAHAYAGADYAQRIAGFNRRMVRALHAAGAGLLLGTDAAQAYHLAGYAVHEELALLVEAGLTPFEALAAGTRDAAVALDAADEFGTVAEGRRADLLLLAADPLEDVAHADRRVGVMLRGAWLPEAELRAALDGLGRSHTPSAVERVWPLALIALGVFFARRSGRARV